MSKIYIYKQLHVFWSVVPVAPLHYLLAVARNRGQCNFEDNLSVKTYPEGLEPWRPWPDLGGGGVGRMGTVITRMALES